MKGRIKRKIVWDKKGVSEIVGTILMLAITVVLFSSIIAWVGKIPAPRESFHVELDCYLEPAVPSDWGLGVNFTMEHQGGQEMDQWFVKIYLTVDDTPLAFDQPDGLIDTDGNTAWGLGERWSQNITKGPAGPLGSSTVPTLSGPDNPSTFSVLVVNVEKNTIIWQETLGEGVNKFPPIIVDMWIDSDLGTPSVMDPGPISYTDPFKVYARIMDPEGFDPDYGLDVNSIWVNLSALYGRYAPPIQMLDAVDVSDGINDDIYVAQLSPPSQDDVSPGNYYFRFNASDLTQPTPMSAEKLKLFPVGMIVGDNPQIIVKEINFNDDEPVNGDNIAISATIWNRGGAGALVDVWFYDGDNGTLIGEKNVSVAAQGEVESEIDWLATPGGVHMIIVEAMVNETYAQDHRIYDPYLDDNIGFQNISVMPKILLVDDDSEINDRGPKDTVSYMRASLEAADYEYDFTIVGAGDGPGYDYGDYPLEDYDVVIWMTGYQTVNTLTKGVGDTDDLDNLRKYLEAGNGTGNGGSLWFVSQGFWAEAAGDADLTGFAENYLFRNTIPMPPTQIAALPLELWGNATNPGHPVTDDFADSPITTTNRVTGAIYERSYYWDTLNDVPEGRMALNATVGNEQCYAVSYDSDADASNPVTDSRIFIQTWDFSRVKDTAKQAQYTYKVIKWLGNITIKYTKDVAISEQTVSPSIVFYKQEVSIRFVIRNNGFENYTLQDDLYYRLRILDVNGNELQPPVLVYEQIDFLGILKNNTRVYYYNWTPQEIGYHRLQIKVDPDNRITESNEWNNEISNYLSSGELFVQYRILVVDDDNSFNNNGRIGAPQDIQYNETLQLTGAMDFLNSTGKYTYEQFVVDESTGGFGPSYDVGTVSLNKYNAVLWVIGDDTNQPLKLTDQQNITDYLDHGGNLWLIGNGMWTAADSTVNVFEQDYLRINTVVGDTDLATTYRGVRDDVVSHGMAFEGMADPNADRLVPEPTGLRPAGTGFFYQNDAMTTYNSVRYHGPTPTNVTTYRVATTSWLLSSLNDDESKAETVFMILRWFDKPEDRIEARVTDLDVWLSDEHPQLGGGYVIQATVHNTGGAIANVLVRFMDGNTQIGSDSISVSPDQTTTAEIIWIPLFAGQRNLRILVDPIAEVDEIFEWSNNNATRDVYVYFFWDDMESGAGKWDHSSTILLINGEEPLEYFYDTELDTNIITQWNEAMTSPELTTCTDANFYHSHDRSYWLQEPAGGTTAGGRIPVDVVIALDSSGSMEWDASGGYVGYDDPDSRWYNARVAAIGFIQELTEFDRCAIYTFNGGSGVSQMRTYEYMNNINKNSFIADLNAFTNVNGMTPFYDMMGEAINYAVSSVIDPDPNPNLLSASRNEFIIGLGDGASNSDNDWTPEANWGATAGGLDGILAAPPMTFVIGLAGISHDPAYPVAPDWSRTAPIDGTYSDEYDMWHVADSSPMILHDAGGKYGENETAPDPNDNVGHYYFTDDPAQLPSIFDEIFETIQQVQLEGENQTKGSEPLPEPLAVIWSDGFESNNFNAWDGIPNDWTIRDNGENDYGGQLVSYVQAGSRCANGHDGNGNHDYLTKTGLDLSGYINRQISYWFDQQDIDSEGEGTWVYIIHDGMWDPIVRWWADDGDQATNNAGDWVQDIINLETDVTITDWSDIGISFRMDSDCEWDDEFMLDDVQVTGDIPVVAPYIVSTVPVNGANDVPVTDGIVVTFSEQIDITTLSWNINPNPGGWTEQWSDGDTMIWLNHSVNYAQSTPYTVSINVADDMEGNPLVAGGTINIDFSDFETNWDGWTTYENSDGDWIRDNGRAIDTWSARARGNGYGYMYKAIDLGSSSSTNLDFYFQYDEVEGADDFEVWASPDGGTGWDLIDAWDGDDYTEDNWHRMSYDLSAYDGNSQFVLSFDWDMSSNVEWWWLDNIWVNSTGGLPNPWTFTTFGPPQITNTNPSDGQIDVLTNQDIIIDFSEPMDTASLVYNCVPNPGGWTTVWSNGDRRATLSHTAFASLQLYTVTVSADDKAGNPLFAGPVPNPWSFTTIEDDPPYIVSTVPANGEIDVLRTQNVIITFSEPMNTATVTYTCIPNPFGWGAVWSGGNTVLTLSHNNFQDETAYSFEVVATSQDTTGNNLDAGPVANPWSFVTEDITPPSLISTTPSDGSTGVGLSQPVIVRFSEAMDKTSVENAFSCTPNPGGWTYEWDSSGVELRAYHYDFNMSTMFQCFVSNVAQDDSGNNMIASATPNPWVFTTGTAGGGGSGGGISPSGANSNKTAVTESVNLEDLESARLSFWHKYNMMPGANGGFLQIGYNVTGNWVWRYLIPANAYTGNLRASVPVFDSFGQRIYWCWNGVSSGGTFEWDYVSVDILDYVPTQYRDDVRVKFNYTQYGGGTGYGWYIDDVRIVVSRSDTVNPTLTSQDIWNLTDVQAHSGNHSWSNVYYDSILGRDTMKPGIDNYLRTTPIDLTNAKNVYLSAYFKFNLNEDSGAPPDGFRVEVTKDGGVSWTPINFGVRSSWGVSGTGLDNDDGTADGKAYTGLSDSGDASADDYWVEADSLSRVNVDLSSFSGNAIQIRFRVVTCSHLAYEHIHDDHTFPAGEDFGGFYVDDVLVYGETILTG